MDQEKITPIVNFSRPKNVKWIMRDQQEKAFNDLKFAISHSLVLTVPNLNKRFEVQVDASSIVLGQHRLDREG
ncbi:hypothetical protein PR048_012479 [Dryococelus australis]|uniref:Reverse transcriptase/retrotransposon-derived protein RNase H-like domain-containing protein n=1 Tax=Dryococelus australis TaxID=614101 RepID=A0ABQ9HQ41_9NEOP|nr:hypothetical protein PR048_012479 [Dryococelus australis]